MDPFTDFPTTLSTPARDGAAVTPSDSSDLSVVPRAIYVGVAGSIAAIMAGGQSVTLQNVAAGSLLPIRVARISATGTTASGLVALW
jgi:hypothetical protein